MQISDKIKKLQIADIKPYPGNAKVHTDEQIQQIKRSIEENLYLNPIIVDKDNTIICGHGRFLAMQEIIKNGDPIEVIDGSHLTPKQVKRFRIWDNKIAEGEWDMDLLEKEIQEIYSDGHFEDAINEIGFDDKYVDEIVNAEKYREQEEIEDDVPEMEECLVIKEGDIIQLGEHRLLCGDSTDKKVVDKLMDGNKADMVFTDPPYNVAYGDSTNPRYTAHVSGKHKVIKNDKQTDNNWIEFNKKLVDIFKIYNIGDLYVWGAPGPDGMRQRLLFIDEGLHWSATIIWKKQRLVLAAGKYQRIYEPCFYGWHKKSGFQADRKQIEVWEVDRPHISEFHPTMKPIKLCENGINNSSLVNNIILDLFGGSGSTLIACQKTSRKCFMMELDRHYCSVIIERYCKYTNEDDIIVNGKQVKWSEYKIQDKQLVESE